MIPSLPEGWTSEEERQNGERLLVKSPKGAVTIDFKLRWWNLGFSLSRMSFGKYSNSGEKRYTGRGWKDILVADAVEALQAVNRPSHER